jgi:hypothetical protein
VGGMMFPKYVKIGAYYYQIKQVTEDKLEGDSVGDISLSDFVIQLWQDLPLILAIETFLHECLHAVLVDLEPPQEEGIVETIANALVMGILDNPALTRLIVNKLLSEKKKCESA